MSEVAINPCAECGDPLTKEEIENPVDKGNGPLCTTCECELYHWQCEFCGNCEDDDYEVKIFAVFDAEAAGVPTGIYRILRRPFYRQPLIGGGDIWPDCVERVADLPVDRHAEDFWYPCAMLCRDCERTASGD